MGKGDGKIAMGMTPKPRDFSCLAMMKDIPDGQLFWVTKNGSKGTGMMGYKTLKDEQVWQIVSYIRQFSK
jgi:mono/diheme cytochrome c family protein